MVSSEVAPYAKTGGLADVVGALPPALRELGHEVAVLVPRYRVVKTVPARRLPDSPAIQLGPFSIPISFFDAGDGVYFLDCPPLYDREGLYGDRGGDFKDNHLRFGLLSRGALEFARRVFRPDILHCHDWQAGLVPVYLKTALAGDPTFSGTGTLFTIHNLGYQGLFSPSVLSDLGFSHDLNRPDLIEFWGNISLLKAGLVFSDRLSTVSPRYAAEIQTPEYGFGLDGLLRARREQLSGILNGVDYSTWNPEIDPHISARYSARDLSGKQTCKRALVEEFGLNPAANQRPLIGIVSRFTGQKGADLIAQSAGWLEWRDAYLVALGSGEPEFEELFRYLAQANPGRVAIHFGYDNPLAHRIEAGADIFLMPSRYEPCGLNQIYSLRYGTVPVVRATGGLDDTIDQSTGFKFQEYSANAMLRSLNDAVVAYGAPDRWAAMMRQGMEKDFSWRVSAQKYSALYARLLNPNVN